MTAFLPKIELHCHIEGAAPPALARRLAARDGVDTTDLFTPEGGYAWGDFTSFIEAYDKVAGLFRSFEDYALLAETYLAASAAEGVIYTEVFVSPDHARRIGIPYVDYIGGIAEGMARAERAYGIIGRMIPLIERHFGPEWALNAVKTALRHRLPQVVGFGMAGDERLGRIEDFVPAFRLAAEAGLPLTCHAGELCGAAMVRATIDALPLKRIGHGVRAIEDASLVRRLAEEGIVLECCPSSNVVLKVFPSFADHPFVRLREAGVKVTLNADDPPFFNTTIGQEYTVAATHFGLDEASLLDITETAARAAFCDTATKEKLLAKIGAARKATQGHQALSS